MKPIRRVKRRADAVVHTRVVDLVTAARRAAFAWFTSAPAALVTVMIAGALTAVGVTRRRHHARRQRVSPSRYRVEAARRQLRDAGEAVGDRSDVSESPTNHPLARVGAGRQDHVLTPSGRPLCETVAAWNWQRTDGTLSPTIPTGTSGHPTCHYCREAL